MDSNLFVCLFLTQNIVFAPCAGILRYRVDFQGMDYQEEDEELYDLDDY